MLKSFLIQISTETNRNKKNIFLIPDEVSGTIFQQMLNSSREFKTNMIDLVIYHLTVDITLEMFQKVVGHVFNNRC